MTENVALTERKETAAVVPSCLNCTEGSPFFPGNDRWAECGFDPGEAILDPVACAKTCRHYQSDDATGDYYAKP